MKNEIIDNNIRQKSIKKGRVIGKKGFPEANSVFKMGIVAAALSFVVAGLVVGILALVKSKKAQEKLNSNPEQYHKQQWKIKMGKALAWVGVGVGGFFAFLVLVSVLQELTKPISEREIFKEEVYEDDFFDDDYTEDDDYYIFEE